MKGGGGEGTLEKGKRRIGWPEITVIYGFLFSFQLLVYPFLSHPGAEGISQPVGGVHTPPLFTGIHTHSCSALLGATAWTVCTTASFPHGSPEETNLHLLTP